MTAVVGSLFTDVVMVVGSPPTDVVLVDTPRTPSGEPVTVGTANFYDPTCAADIVDGLASWAAEQGVMDINELIGAFEC